MKKATYNKKDIMENAWSMFRNNNFDTCDYEYARAEVYGKKTFADCLKEAWGREKEVVDRINKRYEYAETSEEAQAWDWACRKLGVQFDDVTADLKLTWVDEMAKEAWPGTSVWSLAMRAVKLHIELQPSLVA